MQCHSENLLHICFPASGAQHGIKEVLRVTTPLYVRSGGHVSAQEHTCKSHPRAACESATPPSLR